MVVSKISGLKSDRKKHNERQMGNKKQVRIETGKILEENYEQMKQHQLPMIQTWQSLSLQPTVLKTKL